MRVAEAVGRELARLGADTVFGVVGSGNFHVTNGLIAGGARFIAARHEGGATVMADGWARTVGRPGIVSVHQGPGLTNAMTGIAEAAKSRTPLIVLAAEAPEIRSNFHVDVAGLAAAVGATAERVYSPASALADVHRAWQTALGRRTVILALPLNVQAAACEQTAVQAAPRTYPPAPSPEAVTTVAAVLRGADRPVFIAGRGARGRAGRACARAELERLADACGALLATSAVAKGLFRGNPWNLDVSGGFASPLAAELITGADLIVGWGCSLNMWTMRHGKLIGTGATLIQVDDDPGALGAHRPVHLGVLGDVAETARAVADALGPGNEKGDRDGEPWAVRDEGNGGSPGTAGYRSAAVRDRIEREVRWRDVPFEDEGDGQRIDPRALSIALDDLLPAERTVAVDSGNFMGYPSMYLSVPDEAGFCFTQAFQSIGLGLASAIGAAVARPDRLAVAALGDGGALMGASEFETVVRLGIPMVVVVYDDEAYGAEVHHFGPDGDPLDTVRFPPADLAAIARGYGFAGVTVHAAGDLGAVRDWLDGPRQQPLLIDAKVTSERGSWWLEEAFRGH
jgi:acetolactate synthase I/II/III large subunit